MASKREKRVSTPQEEPRPMLPEEPEADRGTGRVDDPDMRDGNESFGNPGETAGDEGSTDADSGDKLDAGGPYAGPSGGAVDGAVAGGRASGGRTGGGISLSGASRGDSTIGTEP
jgi:hypothetical protein